MIRATRIEEVQAAVREHPRLRPVGGATKPALSGPREGAEILDLSGLTGVIEYNPGEFTFTALAGTHLSAVQAMLEGHGQYLPFDPPLVERGATLGGTVASGLSGPGRYRYGGVRDFILGVRLVDGTGRLVRGGGKVVKNSAGFDLPKLMVGSLGRLGVLVEVTFKVFPKSPAHTTVERRYPSLEAALDDFYRVYTARMDIAALELSVQGDGSTRLWVRLGGLPDGLPARAGRIQQYIGGGEVLDEAADAALWREAREFAWVPEGWHLLKAPLTPRRMLDLNGALAGLASSRRYGSGGNVAWVATPSPPQDLDGILSALGLSGLIIFGPPGPVRIGASNVQAFERRVIEVLDPAGRFSI